VNPSPATPHRRQAGTGEPPLAVTSSDGEVQETKPAWIEPAGVGSLLLSGAALLSASVAALCSFVIPLSFLAFLLGVVGLVRALSGAKFRLPLPAVAGTTGGAVLVAALLLPGLLGPAYVSVRVRKVVDRATIRALPLAGKFAAGATEDSGWADAGQVALQQGPLNVQVLEVAISPTQSPPKKPMPPSISIRLRILQPKTADNSHAKWTEKPLPLKEMPQPTLTDNTGRVFCELQFQEIAPEGKTRSVFPVVLVDQVLVFEAPPPQTAFLHLEVPAAAWGGTGVFRFKIPGSMIGRGRSPLSGMSGLK
jgi:hypothetical protein